MVGTKCNNSALWKGKLIKAKKKVVEISEKKKKKIKKKKKKKKKNYSRW